MTGRQCLWQYVCSLVRSWLYSTKGLLQVPFCHTALSFLQPYFLDIWEQWTLDNANISLLWNRCKKCFYIVIHRCPLLTNYSSNMVSLLFNWLCPFKYFRLEMKRHKKLYCLRSLSGLEIIKKVLHFFLFLELWKISKLSTLEFGEISCFTDLPSLFYFKTLWFSALVMLKYIMYIKYIYIYNVMYIKYIYLFFYEESLAR